MKNAVLFFILILFPVIIVSQDITLNSAFLQKNQTIPLRFTCDGENISPPVSWSDSIKGCSSYAIIFEDPDAPVGTWVHWIVYNIPSDVKNLSIGAGNNDSMQPGIQQGINDWGRPAYGGPCPPSGREHRYFFRIYALDIMLDLKRPGKSDIENAMEGHVLGKGEFMVRYRRK